MAFHGISDLKHDPELANALGQMLVSWASAETTLMMTLSCIVDTDLNQIEPAYYRIPTFEARTKFVRSLLIGWKTDDYDKDAISTAIDKLAKLSGVRNGWVHSVWCIRDGETVILDFRAAVDSPDRRRPVKAADVKNHNDAVKRRTAALQHLIQPWLDKYFESSPGPGHPPPPPPDTDPAK